uniref:Uncharacterized protein n=1 Tax=Pipistrellus kuhlii TaxID=59472 RepID=A0A7J7X081_PIPKU|nr:hypothetical protein mPipKuh1_010800 [Pipistrellus kuhlii]
MCVAFRVTVEVPPAVILRPPSPPRASGPIHPLEHSLTQSLSAKKANAGAALGNTRWAAWPAERFQRHLLDSLSLRRFVQEKKAVYQLDSFHLLFSPIPETLTALSSAHVHNPVEKPAKKPECRGCCVSCLAGIPETLANPSATSEMGMCRDQDDRRLGTSVSALCSREHVSHC